jgi:hypothetical protein
MQRGKLTGVHAEDMTVGVNECADATHSVFASLPPVAFPSSPIRTRWQFPDSCKTCEFSPIRHKYFPKILFM